MKLHNNWQSCALRNRTDTPHVFLKSAARGLYVGLVGAGSCRCSWNAFHVQYLGAVVVAPVNAPQPALDRAGRAS
jgi:hypothetical protein